jgi:DNA repair exonuclease SbcCD ATPase subunit
MSPESSVLAVPAEISETIGKVHDDVERLGRELAQALEVWQATLSAEKKQFNDLLEHKELASREQENQWARQTQSYEERLEGMKADFESRLKLTEQNAAHALSELDDAWQRDKLEWVPAARDPWPPEKADLEAKIQSLNNQLADAERLRTQEREGFESRIRDIESRAQVAAGPTSSTVKALQNQLLEFQQTVASFQDRATHSDELVNACILALDYQISVLYDLVQHYSSSSAGPGPSLELA